MSLQNLFVAKLPRNLSDADLHSIFADYEPSSAKIMLDAATGKSKGFGFVLFDSEEKGSRAYESLNKTHVTIHNHNFNLCVFPSKHDGKVATEESNALYIRNIPRTLAQMQVEVFLRNFGNLSYCAMREDHYGSPVWVVYAEYDTVDGAKNALTKLHGNKTYFHDYPAAILAKYADSEEAKRVRRKRRDEVASQLDAAGHYPGPNRIAHGHTKSQDGNPAISVLSHTSSNTSTPPPGFGHQEGHVASVVVGKPNGSAPLPPPNLHTNGYICPNASQTVMVPNDGYHRKNGSGHSIAPLVSTFLNVNPPTALLCNGSCHSFSHYSNQEPSPNGRGTPCTPLSFSFNGNIPDPQQATENTNHAAASNNLCPDYLFNGGSNNNSFAPATPVRRSSNLSTSGTYRHNPYAPVTPINSGASSAGSNSPLTKPVTPSNCQVNVNTHVGGSNSCLHFLQHAYHPIGASPNTAALHNAGMSGYSYSGHFSSPSIFATKAFLEPAS